MNHKFKLSLVFSELNGKGRISDQQGYIEQYRDEWTFDTEEEGQRFQNVIDLATRLVAQLFERKTGL